MRDMDAEELEQYSSLIENSVSLVESNLKDSTFCSDARIVYLAAARANYHISLLGETGGVSSFKAGDVSLTVGGTQSAKAIFEEAKRDSASLITDNGFVFMGV